MTAAHDDRSGDIARRGLVLFTLGLLFGFAIPFCASPRLGLSAHLTMVQSGMFLIGVGLLWPRMGLAGVASRVLSQAVSLSLFALSLGQVLAAVWGGSSVLPIAAAGRRAAPVEEAIAGALIVGGSIGVAMTCLALVFLWRRPAR